ncbi:hypothetical protein M885DRAFT_567033 [Pelagophyceae sp. CCMP2097]|nr:hypothetical protein M885DRAFT_567033 [Pelagophyceae sp. CCMP2097]
MQLDFTRCGRITVEAAMFVDDSGGGAGTSYGYSKRDIDEMLSSASAIVANARLRGARAALTGRRVGDVWLLEGILDFVAPGAAVLVVGSQAPWYEALCLAAGAASVTTLEYNELSFEHPSLSTVRPATFWRSPAKFDVILAASSLDHDGLGRYGDPLSPDGDLLTVDALRNEALKVNGTFLLQVPIGDEDVLAWNVMRIYGPLRLLLLHFGFEIARRYPITDANPPSNWRQAHEPVFALKAARGVDNSDELR